jgi:hypothetical protein
MTCYHLITTARIVDNFPGKSCQTRAGAGRIVDNSLARDLFNPTGPYKNKGKKEKEKKDERSKI